MAKVTQTTTQQVGEVQKGGGIAVTPDVQSALLNQILERFKAQGAGTGGVAELTPELKSAIASMMATPGGQQLTSTGSQLMGQGAGVLSGPTAITGQQVSDMASQLVNKERLNEQLAILGKQSQEGLQKGLSAIESGASLTGGLGSARSALAQAEAIRGSQEELSRAQSGLVGQTYQQAMQQAAGLSQGNVASQLQQGQLLGQLGLGQAGLGGQLTQSQLDNMLKAGAITQEQADKLRASGTQNINTLLAQLGALMGTQQTTDKTLTDTTVQKEAIDKEGILTGVIASGAGAGLDWLLNTFGGDKKKK